ncbi:MAG: PEGA domain-containing protein [Deltaproteobacteria bacterium]|nr:MAG: PEGA domain-containing protein [Deltaproteobacteria bacterium]
MSAEDHGAKRGGTRAFGTPEPGAVQPAGGAAPAAPVAPPSAPTQIAFGADDDPLVGQTLAGRYKIERRLGEGGMGAVYLGLHVALEKRVALKVLHGEFVRKPDLVERFLQEAKAASKIRHDNVIDITDFGQTEDGLVFFAMELLDGRDLSDELGRLRAAGEVMPWERIRHIFLQIGSALSAAHAKGIIHRDLKPENIYLIERLGQRDFVKLLDFGIAKLTEVNEEGRKLTKTGMLFGTPEYMSPEQARGEKVDHRVDIYAMGCILYQMLAGHVPFEADNFMGILTLHLTQEPPPLGPVLARSGAPPQVEAIVRRALAKDKEQRYGSIDEMMADILALDDGLSDSFDRAGAAAGRLQPATDAAGPAAWTGTANATAVASSAGGRRTGLWIGLGALAVAAVAGGALALRGGSDDTAAATAQTAAAAAERAGQTPAAGEPPRGAQGARSGEPPRGAQGAESGETNAGRADSDRPGPTEPGGGGAAEPADLVSVVIKTEPRGARVRNTATGEIVGETPVTVRLPRGDDPVLFEIAADGYKPYDLIVTPTDSRDHDIRLERARRSGRRGGRHATPARAETGKGKADTKPAAESPGDRGGKSNSELKVPDELKKFNGGN